MVRFLRNALRIVNGKYAFLFGFSTCFILFGYALLILQYSTLRDGFHHYGLLRFQEYEKLYELVDKVARLDRTQNETVSRWPIDQYRQNTMVADLLEKEVKILCWVMTSPATHHTKAIHIKNTWGKRCNKLLFMSTIPDAVLETVALPVDDGRDFLWAKTKEAFRYIYRYHLDDYDWFYKADDDTYAIVENLRYLLFAYKPTMPIYFGCKFKPYVKQGYMSGGAGYVLSKEAVRRFAETGIHNTHECKLSDGGAEDIEMGKCMEKLGVIAGDSRDSLNRGKFFSGNAANHFGSNAENAWEHQYLYYGVKKGFECCSNNAISFHYIKPYEMYTYEYFIYHLQPFGVMSLPQVLPAKLTRNEIIEMNKVPATNKVTIPLITENKVINKVPINNNLVSFKHYNLSRNKTHN